MSTLTACQQMQVSTHYKRPPNHGCIYNLSFADLQVQSAFPIRLLYRPMSSRLYQQCWMLSNWQAAICS